MTAPSAQEDESTRGTCPLCARPISRRCNRGDRKGRPTGDWTCNTCCAAWADRPVVKAAQR